MAAVLPLGHAVNGMIALTNMLTLLLLWSRGRSVLDLWLMVAVCALIGEGVMVAFFVTARFIFGFYATRMISLVVSKVVLIVLLSETVILYARLSIANRNLQRERENKLTSAEAVVAAIAHEVRQPLAGISSQAGAGQRFLDRASPDVDEGNGALRADKRLTPFVRMKCSKAFSACSEEARKNTQPVDMNALALEAVQLLRNELDDHNITIRTKLASELPIILGNTGQLREVILNLIQNAIEAMATTTNRPRVISVVTARLWFRFDCHFIGRYRSRN